jgi:hypothetical protein
VGSIPASRTKLKFATLCGGVFVCAKSYVRQGFAEFLTAWSFAIARGPAGLQTGLWTGFYLKRAQTKPGNLLQSHAGQWFLHFAAFFFARAYCLLSAGFPIQAFIDVFKNI